MINPLLRLSTAMGFRTFSRAPVFGNAHVMVGKGNAYQR